MSHRDLRCDRKPYCLDACLITNRSCDRKSYSLDGCPMFADSGVRGSNKTGEALQAFVFRHAAQ